MAIEYLGLSQINGPLVILEGVENASFDEIVEITVAGKEKKLGRIVEIYEDKAIIQVFESTENMSLTNTATRLTGHPMEVALSMDILELYPHRYFRHRRPDHPDQRPEAADFFRQRTAP